MRDEQPWKQEFGKAVSVEGKTISVSEVQFRNALTPMLFKLLPRAMDDKDEQPENALSPMEVTPFGNCNEVSAEQPENARTPMEVTVSGKVTERRDAHS